MIELTAFESEVEALDDGFCQWFTGWSDVIGHFGSELLSQAYTLTNCVSVSSDEIKTLELVKSNLGVVAQLATQRLS